MSERGDHDAITSIRAARQRVERARAALKRAEVDLVRRVAGAVWTDWTRPAWYAALGFEGGEFFGRGPYVHRDRYQELGHDNAGTLR